MNSKIIRNEGTVSLVQTGRGFGRRYEVRVGETVETSSKELAVAEDVYAKILSFQPQATSAVADTATAYEPTVTEPEVEVEVDLQAGDEVEVEMPTGRSFVVWSGGAIEVAAQAVLDELYGADALSKHRVYFHKSGLRFDVTNDEHAVLVSEAFAFRSHELSEAGDKKTSAGLLKLAKRVRVTAGL